jgi:predicted metal-dependent phosphoesterase TrpH
MRCDLHVHSRFSGRSTLPVLRHLVDECYLEPEEVYQEARRRGMDLVTLTDHDTVAGAARLAGRADTFVSEEVTCLLPGGRELHLGVYDLGEAQHEGITARRADAEALFAYLAEEHLPMVLNHPFSALTGARDTADLDLAFARVRLVEARNGMLPPDTNRYATAAAEARGCGLVGGSDSHTRGAIATAWTVVPGARDRAEFLAGLRVGHTLPAGDSGTYARFVTALASIAAAGVAALWRAPEGGGSASVHGRLALVAALPLLGLLPLAAALVHGHEQLFAYRLHRAFGRVGTPRPRLATA